MPTNGYLTFRVTQVDIKPLTFGELIKYLGDEQLTPSREYIRALKYLISKDPGIGELSILDADYILYIFKSISSSNESKLVVSCVCDHCKNKHSKSFKLNKIEFSDVNEQAMKIDHITLAGRQIKIKYPTINEFIEFFGKLGRFEDSREIDILKLLSMMDLNPNEAIPLLDNLIQGDIALINYLDTALFKLVKPLTIPCPDYPNLRGTTAAFVMSAVDIFRSIIHLNTTLTDKISIRETRSSSEYREDVPISG